MAKYSPLGDYLRCRDLGIWTASFKDVEQVLRFSLPNSARKHRAWWSNEERGHHSHAHAWTGVGWHVDHAEIDLQMVRFRRDEPFRPPNGAGRRGGPRLG